MYTGGWRSGGKGLTPPTPHITHHTICLSHTIQISQYFDIHIIQVFHPCVYQ